MPQLTREEMEAVIASGGSVLHKGQTLWKMEHLPSAADLVAGDPAGAAAVGSALDAQIAHLQNERAKLETNAATAPGGAPATKAAAPPDTSGADDPRAEKNAKKAAADSGKG